MPRKELLHQGMLSPPAIIGVFGSGQLGRMLALAARAMGYRIHTFSPEQNSPTGQVADREVCAPYDDLDAVRDFVRQVDVVTFEFENVAAAVAQVAAEESVPVRPGGHVLHTCLLYTSDAADERSSVDLGGRRILKKKN